MNQDTREKQTRLRSMDCEEHLKLYKDTKWLDRVKMEELHAMDNSQGGVDGHTR
jgi:hypothetical protein